MAQSAETSAPHPPTSIVRTGEEWGGPCAVDASSYLVRGAKRSTLSSLYPQPKGEASKAACTASGLGVSTTAKSRKQRNPQPKGEGQTLATCTQTRKSKRPLRELRAPGIIRRLGPTRGFAGCRVGQVVRGRPSRLHVNPPRPTRSSK